MKNLTQPDRTLVDMAPGHVKVNSDLAAGSRPCGVPVAHHHHALVRHKMRSIVCMWCWHRSWRVAAGV